MKISKAGISLIKNFESCKLKAYKCSAGVWTIGYGHTFGVSEGDTITQHLANEYLVVDLKTFESQINDLSLAFRQSQFDALVSFAFNCGIGNLKSSTLLRLVKENPDDLKIADAFIMWIKAAGKPLRGLLKRRLAESLLYFSW